MTSDALMACAEIIRGTVAFMNTMPRCNVARCGATGCADFTYRDGVYAGMLPVKFIGSAITGALTQLPGSPADPRQDYDVAFDNPSMTLHIVGDDLQRMDAIAEAIIKLDMRSHITTQYGEVNGIRINPAQRTVRNDRPRYELLMTIDMEMVRA